MKLPRVASLVVLALLLLSSIPAAPKDLIDQSVERGVAYLRQLQAEDGTWPHQEIGATALAGLTLLECGVRAEDQAVEQAAAAVRSAGISTTSTYSISLCLLFLDRLGDPGDVPLIESLTVRLLAGQNAGGGWSYQCPDISAAEVRRLTAHLRQRNELVGQRQPPDVAPTKRRTVQDLSPEIQQQLKQLVNRLAPVQGGRDHGGDNSNTQFATLALWVGRRHGLPVDAAVARVVARFRGSQNPDGGWGYKAGSPGHGVREASTATMTCAGLLGLAVGHGTDLERAREQGRQPAAARALAADRGLQLGVLALGSAIGQPLANLGPGRGPAGKGKGKGAQGRGPGGVPGGRTYYFLWSLERVAMALGLQTVGGKDWYRWGAEILLASQHPDGSWHGEYGRAGVDTCFALLFLRRANLARDLTADLRGKVQDPDEAILKAKLGPGLKPAIEFPDAERPDTTARPDPGTKPVAEPLVSKPAEPSERRDPPRELRDPPRPTPEPVADSNRLARELVQARAEEHERVLERLRDGKGVIYTEALAAAIPGLDADHKPKARQALASRLTRMKAEILANYLKDPDPEIRRAAALAIAMKDSKIHIPHLIPLLSDPEQLVARAAHVALKELSGQNFGPGKEAWQEWWNRQK